MKIFDPNDDALLNHLNQELNAFRKPAPKELWQSIVDDMDQSSHSDEQLDKHLNEEFSHFHKKAPLGLWNQIESDLDENNNHQDSTDRSLDEKIRNTYNSTSEAPESVWWNIEQQLNIDGIWQDMAPQLDTMRNSYLWRKRIRQFSMAAALLLLLRGCGFFPSFHSVNDAQQPVPVTEQREIQPATQHIAENSAETTDMRRENSSNTQSSQPGRTEENDLNSAQTQVSNMATSTPSIAHPSVALNKKGDITTVGPLLNKLLHDKLPEILPEVYTSNQHEIQEIAQKIDHSKTIVNENPESDAYTAIELPVIAPKLLAADLPPAKELVVQIVRLKRPFRPFVEVGLVGALRSNTIINDANFKITNAQVQSSPLPFPLNAPGYGVGVDYVFHKKHSIATEIWLKSKACQRYQYSNNGKLYTKNVELDYAKASLSHRFIPVTYGFAGRNNLNIRSGLYAAILKSEKTTYTSRASSFPQQEVNKWDAGFLLSIGQQHKFRIPITFEYGLLSEIGFRSIFNNSKSHGNSNLFGWGAYAALKYRFGK